MIEVRDAKKWIQNGARRVEILKGITLTIPAGQFLSLIHIWSLVLLLVALSPLAIFGSGAEKLRRVHFQEVDTLFANPGEGWMEHSSQSARFPSSVTSVSYTHLRGQLHRLRQMRPGLPNGRAREIGRAHV